MPSANPEYAYELNMPTNCGSPVRRQPKGEVANSLLAGRDRGEGANRLHDVVYVLNLTVGVDPLSAAVEVCGRRSGDQVLGMSSPSRAHREH